MRAGDNISVDYKKKYEQQQQVIKDNYATFEVPYNGKDNDNYVDGEGFCCEPPSDSPKGGELRSLDPGKNDNYERAQFYYHPDHLGSSSFITNLDGDVVQHIEYVPFGEVFIEERNNVWNTPYLFNAKELDEETGLYYYGARYYNPRTSLWISVDPLAEKRIWSTSYNYCQNNPVNRTDPTGMLDDDHYINKDGSINSVKTEDTFDRFFVEDFVSNTGYKQVAQLEKNEFGLVNFPSEGEGFNRYGSIDKGGISTNPVEIVGQGDHYLKPETAAALFGLINDLNSRGLSISLGDMSSFNGSDPWQPGFPHHGGHGHLGKRSGLDIDFRYLNTEGRSFQSANAFREASYSQKFNQRVYDSALKFGFTKNYQGTSGNLTGPPKVNGHNDHGHLGLQHNNLKWKYVRIAPIRKRFNF